MSKNDLYRTPADDNPTQTEKLPKEPLDFKFPITTKPSVPFTLRGFLLRLALVSLIGVAAPLSLVYHAFIVGLLAVVFLVAYIRRIYKRIGPKVGKRVGSAFFVTHFTCLTAYKGHGGLATIVFFSTVAYTLHVAVNFRRHWMQRAASGMMPKTVIQNFLQDGKLPTGVRAKPTLPAFLAALRSWITYDPYNSQAVGVAKCPKGRSPTSYRGVSHASHTLGGHLGNAPSSVLDKPVW